MDLEADLSDGIDLPRPTEQSPAGVEGLREPIDRQHDGPAGKLCPRSRRKARDRRDQPSGIGMLRIGEHFLPRAELDENSFAHDADAVRDLRHHPEVMGDEQNARTTLSLKITDQAQDLGLRRDIQGRRGLVGNQEPGPQGKRHRNDASLPLAAGKLMRVGVVDLRRVG